jgi:hypothetical protein
MCGTEHRVFDDFAGNLYMLANHHLVNFDGENNPQLCGMVSAFE